MAKSNKKQEIEKQLKGFTIQMDSELHAIIHRKTGDKNCKLYELVNTLLLQGIKKWVKTQPKDYYISINHPDLALARKMAQKLETKTAKTKITKAKVKKEKGLKGFTIQMDSALHSLIHSKADLKRCKLYQLVNTLLLYGIEEWTKQQAETSDDVIDINHPKLVLARRMMEELEAKK
jgi:hypothetical protein